MSGSVSLEYLQSALNTPGMSAQNFSGATLALVPAGTAVPLTTNTYQNGFSPNAAYTQFTVAASGMYFIIYDIRIVTSVLVSAGVFRNGVEVPSLSRVPGAAANSFTCSSITYLDAGNVLQLTLFGLLGSTTLRDGPGAYMNIIKIN